MRTAAAALAGVAVRAPLIDAPFLTARTGHPVRLKAEMRQPMGAFKLRGAYTAVSRLATTERARGACLSGPPRAFTEHRAGIVHIEVILGSG